MIDIACFCEKNTFDDLDGRCYPWNIGTTTICFGNACADCDMTWCPPGRIYEYSPGVIIEANIIKIKNKSYTSEYFERGASNHYISGMTINLVKEASNVKVERKNLLKNANIPKGIINLTSAEIKNNRIFLDKKKKYGFIPFDSTISPYRVISEPTCKSDPNDPCTGRCELEPDSQGCLSCKCQVDGGDCDMEINGSSIQGGLLVESA